MLMIKYRIRVFTVSSRVEVINRVAPANDPIAVSAFSPSMMDARLVPVAVAMAIVVVLSSAMLMSFSLADWVTKELGV